VGITRVKNPALTIAADASNRKRRRRREFEEAIFGNSFVESRDYGLFPAIAPILVDNIRQITFYG
jgi:hypothetical protein